jgi:ADP-heptose:LPS heptosyltransferase
MNSENRSAGAAVITFKQLGDTLLLEPTLHTLRARFGVPATLFAKPGFEPLIELMADARLPAGSGSPFEQLWVFEPGTKAARKALFTRAKEKRVVLLRPKYLKWYHRLIFDRIRTESPGFYEYRARFLNREAGGFDGDFRPPSLKTPPEKWAPQWPFPADYLLLCPTAAWESKRWSAEAWGKAIEGIAAQCGVPMLMVGGGSEWERIHSAQIEACTGPAITNLVGRTSLRELLFLVSKARAALCIDGAVAHLAAAFEVPSITMFGPTRSVEWHWPTVRSIALCAEDYSEEKLPALTDLPFEPVVSAAVGIVKTGP